MLIVRKILTKKKQRSAPLDSDAWIFDAMTIAKSTASVPKLIPVAGPYIEGGANLFYDALGLLKQMKKNKEDFKGLAEAIANLLSTFNEAIAVKTSDSTYPPEFLRMCSDFQSSMEKLSKEISLLITDSETKRLKRYIHADQIREIIANYQMNIQILRENLIVYCTLSTRVQLFETDKKVSNILQERNIALNEDFSELQEVLQTDIRLKEEVNVIRSKHTGSLLFKEYHGTISFNGEKYSATTRSYEGESAHERLKAELKLLARIRHPNITQVAAVCFSRSFPSIVYYDDLRPVDWSSEDARMRDGPYTISYLTGLYRQMSKSDKIGSSQQQRLLRYIFPACRCMPSECKALVHIIDKLPSFFIGSPRNAPDNPDIGFIWWSIVGWESPSTKGILRVYIAGDGRPLLSLAPPRTNSSQQDMEEGSIGAVVYAYSDNYISENTLRQIECQEEERLDPSKEVITSSLRALFHIILYTRDYGDSRVEPHRAEPPYLGAIYYQCACRWELTPIGRKLQAVGIFPLKSHHYQCRNWTTGTDPEPAEWQARACTARRIQLKFDQPYLPVNTGSFQEYEFLQEFNRCLGKKVAKYWAFMAAPELLPESLKLYDPCATGHDFEYGKTGIDPIYGEIPSRCWNFLKGHEDTSWYDEKLPHYFM
ncbi:hypothetical protein M422DRAFT_255451 [Sphaerobolus stellatus SS14]|uniref:Protein kinase domain-containing protein n=1 Tax=Sphaerobolus stellatus (strain SS14) TaxID=990650 RepID=A0A0C9VTR1_SPHS4|nr:hypothetical protein M422DRAFT_255451 [Sphaerobolus stellatus SS14]